MRTHSLLSIAFATVSLFVASVACSETTGPAGSAPSASSSGEPDYSAWNSLLNRYYDPARGMDYRNLKAKDGATLGALRARMARVNVGSLSPKQQLANWINLYNINVVGIVADHYPVDSIRDISTDPIIRLNVFKKDHVPLGGVLISLDEIENKWIREGFKDARIHFAINCAAKSCPPIRTEAYVGARIDAQLDDQARRFLNGPQGVKVRKKGDKVTVATTRLMDWFKTDFEQWAGGSIAFIRKYASYEKVRMIDGAGGKVRLEYDPYDWALNDWKR